MRRNYWKTIGTVIATSLLLISTACADVITTFKHGEGNHTVVERNADGSRTWTTTDAKGVVTTKTFGRPGGYVEWTDDEGNDHTWTNTQDGQWTRTTVSPDGKKTVTRGERLPKGTFIDGSGNRTKIIPQADGSRLWVTTRPDGTVTRRTVGKPGGRVVWKDQQGNKHEWTSKPDGTWQRITIAPDGTRTVTKGRFQRPANSKKPAVANGKNQPAAQPLASQPIQPLGPIVLNGMKLPLVTVKLSPAGAQRRIEQLREQDKSLTASYKELYRSIRERQKQILAELKTLRASAAGSVGHVSGKRKVLIQEYSDLTDFGRAIGEQVNALQAQIRKEMTRLKG